MRYEYKFVNVFKSVSPEHTLDEEKINEMGKKGYKFVNVFIKPGFPAMHQIIIGIFEKELDKAVGEKPSKPIEEKPKKRGRPKKQDAEI